MSLFDLFSKAVSSVTTSNIQGMVSMANPVELTNLQEAGKLLTEKVTAATAAPNQNGLIHLRTFLMSHFGHLVNGGEPAPDAMLSARIKADPRYTQLCAEYQTLHNQLAALELTAMQCTYGFQMADGSIVVPDLSWSHEKLEQVQAQAVHQTARCWMNADKTQYAQ